MSVLEYLLYTQHVFYIMIDLILPSSFFGHDESTTVD